MGRTQAPDGMSLKCNLLQTAELYPKESHDLEIGGFYFTGKPTNARVESAGLFFERFVELVIDIEYSCSFDTTCNANPLRAENVRLASAVVRPVVCYDPSTICDCRDIQSRNVSFPIFGSNETEIRTFPVACDGNCPSTSSNCQCPFLQDAFSCAPVYPWRNQEISEFSSDLVVYSDKVGDGGVEIYQIFLALRGSHPTIDCSNNTFYRAEDLPCPTVQASNTCAQCNDNANGNVIEGAIAIAGGLLMALCTFGHLLVEIRRIRLDTKSLALKPSAWANQ